MNCMFLIFVSVFFFTSKFQSSKKQSRILYSKRPAKANESCDSKIEMDLWLVFQPEANNAVQWSVNEMNIHFKWLLLMNNHILCSTKREIIVDDWQLEWVAFSKPFSLSARFFLSLFVWGFFSCVEKFHITLIVWKYLSALIRPVVSEGPQNKKEQEMKHKN